MELIKPNGDVVGIPHGDWPASFGSNGETYTYARLSEEKGETWGVYVRQSDKAEVKYSLANAKALAEKASEEKVIAFRADFNTPGIMKLEVNVEALSHSMEGQFQFMGFMDHHKAKVLQIISRIVAQREAMKVEIQKETNKGLFRGFLGKKR